MDKNKIIGLLAVALIGVYLFYKSIKKIKKMITESEIKTAFNNLKTVYSPEILRNAEKIYRLETAHFSTNNFKNTFGAGFEAAKNYYPFGWNSLKSFWDAHPNLAPKTFYSQNENVQKDISGSGKLKKFLIFPNLTGGIRAVCEILSYRGNDVGRYFSNDIKSQEQYRNKISKIKTKYV